MDVKPIIEILKTLNFTNFVWVYALPMSLMGLDVMTGFVNAYFKEKNFQSSIMRKGLTKKIGEIAIILTAIVVSYGLDIPLYLLKGISLYIIVMEMLSIFENADKMGVPIPGFVKSAINNVHQAIDNDSASDAAKKIAKLEAILAENHIQYNDDLK